MLTSIFRNVFPTAEGQMRASRMRLSNGAGLPVAQRKAWAMRNGLRPGLRLPGPATGGGHRRFLAAGIGKPCRASDIVTSLAKNYWAVTCVSSESGAEARGRERPASGTPSPNLKLTPRQARDRTVRPALSRCSFARLPTFASLKATLSQ